MRPGTLGDGVGVQAFHEYGLEVLGQVGVRRHAFAIWVASRLEIDLLLSQCLSEIVVRLGVALVLLKVQASIEDQLLVALNKLGAARGLEHRC